MDNYISQYKKNNDNYQDIWTLFARLKSYFCILMITEYKPTHYITLVSWRNVLSAAVASYTREIKYSKQDCIQGVF